MNERLVEWYIDHKSIVGYLESHPQNQKNEDIANDQWKVLNIGSLNEIMRSTVEVYMQLGDEWETTCDDSKRKIIKWRRFFLRTQLVKLMKDRLSEWEAAKDAKDKAEEDVRRKERMERELAGQELNKICDSLSALLKNETDRKHT